MTKTFTPKPGDKWTKDTDGMLWVYRKDCAVVFSRTGFTAGPVTCRSAHEIDINTFAAHAQLREWGYEVTGEQLAGDEQPITESRVREIVAQMLAAQPTPAEVREAAPEPDWKGLLERVCDAADFVIDTDETPESNCSCHIDPPCLDCEEYAGRRQAIDELNAALAAARKAVGK